jgi:predicted dehydrogenase
MDILPGLSRRRFIGSGSLPLAAAFSIVAPQSVRGSRANSQVSFGLIGSGARGTYDAGIVQRDPRARVTALCDVFDDRIGRTATQLKIEKPAVYRDFDKLLAAQAIDAVIIAAPPFEHPRMFEAAVQARKHVYCEMPMGIDLEGCRCVIRAARRAATKKCISAGLQRRYSPVYLEAYERIRSGRIGTLIGARGFRLAGGPGGLVAGQDCQSFDVLHWFLGGPPHRVVGMGGRKPGVSMDTLDHLSLTIEFPGGILANYDATRSSPLGLSRMGEEFRGSTGVIHTSCRAAAHARDMTIDALEGFIGRILSGNVETTAERSALSTLIAILGRAAIDENRQVTWKELGSLN